MSEVIDALPFDKLNLLIDRGIIGPKTKLLPLSFGFRGGTYLGAPGKDIYVSLDTLSPDEMKLLAEHLASKFPKNPPGNHVQYAACIRYVYGCFEKQGCLRSEVDKQRLITEQPDWDLPLRFVTHMCDFFREHNNHYGLIIHHEMYAHRLGDQSIIRNDKSLLQQMLDEYQASFELAKIHGSPKHMFTPFFWAGGYFYEMNELQQMRNCYLKCLRNMEGHCPDAREGYREKAKIAIERLLATSSNSEKKELLLWLSKCKNKCLQKIKSAFRKRNGNCDNFW